MALAAGAVSASELRRYSDPATELEVLRLTDPAFPSGMTAPHLRPFTRRSDMLLYWSERTGTRQAFLANLKTGESTQLTDATALDPASLCLTPDDRGFVYFDGQNLFESPLLKPAAKQLYRVPEGTERKGLTVAGDGAILFAEGRRVIRLFRGQARPLFDAAADVTGLEARPGNLKAKAQLLFRQGDALWVQGRALKTEPGKTGEALWIPSGRTLIYLHIPDGQKELITLREHNPDTGADTLIAKTSQFISAAPNADASVFAAASRSVASPYVLITLRVTRRELTLCEHHASDAAMVNPVFTPDSKTIAFVSDRHGKSAVYLMNVARFVEETGGDSGPDQRD